MEILYKLMHLGAFVKNQLVVSIWVKFWIFYSVPLTCKLVFIPMTCCFNYYSFVEMLSLSENCLQVFPLLLRLTVVLIVFLTVKAIDMHYKTQILHGHMEIQMQDLMFAS